MSKMGFVTFYDQGHGSPLNYVAPKSDYTTEEFIAECEEMSDGYYTLGEAKEAYCRWYPVAPEGIDLDEGCYSFCEPGKGAFPVWYCDINPV
ncbi:hypothetical protein [Paenibacillus glucanolyticus]|uniref:hypothetical protein n=1 Tax=Paenibacillus glucanolyticus TaxID=59843 RepID=UPI00117E560C|nr:hypothetical protein [Paenibacillus glucanolyticus]